MAWAAESIRSTGSHPRIFALELPDAEAFFIDGRMVVVDSSSGRALERALGGDRIDPEMNQQADALRDAADQAAVQWEASFLSPFEPRCLAIDTNSGCRMGCTYCYAQPNTSAPIHVPDGAVRAASQWVAANCVRYGAPMSVVFQGPGEPSEDWPRLMQLVEITRSAARNSSVAFNAHLTTHGHVDVQQAQQIAQTFASVAVSCDGPPGIACESRRMADPAVVETTCKVIRSGAAKLSIRATVTPTTLPRLVDIVDYAVGILGAQEVRIEPVYHQGMWDPVVHPRLFASAFLAAQASAQRHGARCEVSCVDLARHHGPACDVQRGVVRLGHRGVARGCFLTGPPGYASDLGGWNPDRQTFELSNIPIGNWRARLSKVAPGCSRCFLAYHCMRGCPEVCFASTAGTEGGAFAFRCELSRLVGGEWVRNEAMTLLRSTSLSTLR